MTTAEIENPFHVAADGQQAVAHLEESGKFSSRAQFPLRGKRPPCETSRAPHRIEIVKAFNPNSEVEAGRKSGARGAHAAGVRFSAVRRKLRSTKYFFSQSGES